MFLTDSAPKEGRHSLKIEHLSMTVKENPANTPFLSLHFADVSFYQIIIIVLADSVVSQIFNIRYFRANHCIE